jgi:hypothetical protein
MATPSCKKIMLCSKYFIRTGWALLMLLSLFIIYNNAFRYFNFSSPAYSDDLKPFAGVLIIISAQV